MAAMAKIAAGAKDVQWFHDIVKENSQPVESETEIMERIKNGVNKFGGSENGPI